MKQTEIEQCNTRERQNKLHRQIILADIESLRTLIDEYGITQGELDAYNQPETSTSQEEKEI
jgi:hypothetical protein